MSVMTPRRLEQLRRRADLEGCGPATQDYIIGLKVRNMELQDQVQPKMRTIYKEEKNDDRG